MIILAKGTCPLYVGIRYVYSIYVCYMFSLLYIHTNACTQDACKVYSYTLTHGADCWINTRLKYQKLISLSHTTRGPQNPTHNQQHHPTPHKTVKRSFIFSLMMTVRMRCGSMVTTVTNLTTIHALLRAALLLL